MAASAAVIALAATGLSSVGAAADELSDLTALLDLTRPELAAVAARLAEGNDAAAAEELRVYYAGRTGIELPVPGGTGGGDSTADELAAGIFRFGDETRDFYDDVEHRIDIDWEDLWGGTEEAPGSAQVLMSDLTFMPALTSAYTNEADPQKRAGYAAAWMDITLDFFGDNPTWPIGRNLSGAKRLAQLITSFSVFRAEPTIDADDVVLYLSGIHDTTDQLALALERHRGNNWYMSMARSIYLSAVYLPEFSAAQGWEWFAVRSAEWFVHAYVKSDGVYRESTVNYHAYVADLLNSVIRMADANGRELPASLAASSDWLADSLFATRLPNLDPPLIGDAPNIDAGASAIRTSGARNDWGDFTWVGTGRTQGVEPTLPSAVYPISFAVQRSGWDADARYMLINNQNTPYTGSHRHPDDLSVVMAAYGRPLIVDPGAADYSATPTNDWMRRTTEAHNTIEVDGRPQQAGVTRATWLWRSNDGLDIYQGTALGYRPITHDRVVYFVKPGFWIVSDDLTGDTSAHDYRQLWHFPGDPVVVDAASDVATVGFDTVAGQSPVSGVQLVPVAAEGVEISPTVHDDGAVRVREDVLTDVEYLSYDWTTAGETGLDTVVFPGAAGAAPDVTASRIPLGVAHSVATALQIDLPNGTGCFYLSREDTPAYREFGSAATEGETAYLERDDAGSITRFALTSGSSLADGGATLVEASDVVSDLDVQLTGSTARLSLGDPFTGTITIYAPAATVVMVNGRPATFTRTGDLVTITLEPIADLETVLEERFDDADLDRIVYDFEDGDLEGWAPLQGEWSLGGADGAALAQTSSGDMQSFAIQYDAPNDVVVSAEIVPGTRPQTTARTGLAFRFHDIHNYYKANVLNTADGAVLQLIKVYEGTATTLATTDIQLNADAAHTLTVTAVGSHLTATIGAVTISADDTRLTAGGVATYTHRRAATFDDITIAEALDQSTWTTIGGEVSVDGGQLHIEPVDDRAHILAVSTMPERFSVQCDYAASAAVTLGGVGQAGISLRDSTDSYGYRIHVGKTSRGTWYASVIREAHRSGPVTLASVSLGKRPDGPVELGAAVHGDRLTVTIDGDLVADVRDTVVRSGGVGLYATVASTIDDLTVAQSCGSDEQVLVPEPQHWAPGATYTGGDLVTHDGAVWMASWWTQDAEPGRPYGAWQEIAVTDDGTALWTPSRVFVAGDVVEHDSQRYRATWWTRNQAPGDPYGPWELVD